MILTDFTVSHRVLFMGEGTKHESSGKDGFKGYIMRVESKIKRGL